VLALHGRPRLPADRRRTQPLSFLPALVGFNVGVELGRLAVVASAFLLVGWFRSKSWYRSAIVVPASLAIALVGLYWAVQRVFGDG